MRPAPSLCQTSACDSYANRVAARICAYVAQKLRVKPSGLLQVRLLVFCKSRLEKDRIGSWSSAISLRSMHVQLSFGKALAWQWALVDKAPLVPTLAWNLFELGIASRLLSQRHWGAALLVASTGVVLFRQACLRSASVRSADAPAWILHVQR